ncbi:17035_t:CDS:2, partial [Gigaspora margarita]
LFKHMDNKFDKAKYEIEATSMTNRRTYTHVINDKNTDESTYLMINKEATDNFENEDNLEEHLKFEKTYTTIHKETTKSTTNNSRSKVNLEEQLLRSVDQEHSYILVFDTDSSDKESNNTFSTLTLGQTFITWDDAEKFLDSYGLEKGKYKAKKVLNPDNQRNRQSRATDCKWRVNGNLSKNTSMISFTTVVDE